MRRLPLACLPVVLALLASCATVGAPVRQVAGGLAIPWGVAFLPDGSALVAERDRERILRVTPSGGVSVAMTLPEVAAGGEGGLLGLAVSPSYARDGRVFAYLTSDVDNRVVRFTLGGARTPIVTGIPKSNIHNGGRIAFGPDGHLYIATGDAGNSANAQNVLSLGGKILRVDQDGRPAPGNPFGPIYSLGHRNVQGLAWDAAGRMYATEFGQHTWDEVNRIVAGGNYGWPVVEGPSNDPRFQAPLTVWRPAEASPSGLAYAGGALWAGALRGERLWRLQLDGNGNISARSFDFHGSFGRLRTVVVEPGSQALWVTTSNGSGDQVLRVPLVHH